MFTLQDTPLHADALKQALGDPRAGACVTFEGWVRNHNEGQVVTALEYEAYPELAISEGQAIVAEALRRFAITSAVCVHRTGRLAIGELAVWVGVSAPHRQAAYDASRFIIDAIKHRVPIWKKEFYANGDSGWVNCPACAQAPEVMAPLPNAHQHDHGVCGASGGKWSHYYDRQVCLPEVGHQGQQALERSRVLVVGAGGLGSPALIALAQAGVGTLGVCDFDTVAVSNLHRQGLYGADDVGQPKVKAAHQTLARINPMVQVVEHEEGLTAANAEGLFKAYDVVLGCTDNFEAQFLMSDVAVLTQTALIQASVYQYEGWIQGWFPTEQGGGCLRCLWPVQPQAGCTGSCQTVGTLGAVVQTLGSMQAMEALKLLLGMPRAVTSQTMLLVDLLTMTMQSIRQAPLLQCPICHGGAEEGLRQTPLSRPSTEPIGLGWGEAMALVMADTITNAMDRGKGQAVSLPVVWVDIREDHEKPEDLSVKAPDGSDWWSMPMSLLDPAQFQAESTYVLGCVHGLRSQYLARQLRRLYGLQVYSLIGGFSSPEAVSANPATVSPALV